MQLKFKTIAALVTLAVAGQASAALSEGIAGPNSDNGGTLFFTAWDSVANVSYTRDLGAAFNSFLPNSVSVLATDGGPATGNKTPSAGTGPITFAGDTLFSSTFAGSTAANIRWAIFGHDDAEDPTLGKSRLLSTVVTLGNPNNSGIRTSAAGISAFNAALNANFGCDTAASCAGPSGAGASTQLGFGGAPSLVGGFGTSLNGTNVAATGFSSTAFYYFATTVENVTAGTTTALRTLYQNATNVASWTLAADGGVTYNLAGEAPAVPLPAAAWLLGAGLMGIGAAARRRKQEAASELA